MANFTSFQVDSLVADPPSGFFPPWTEPAWRHREPGALLDFFLSLECDPRLIYYKAHVVLFVDASALPRLLAIFPSWTFFVSRSRGLLSSGSPDPLADSSFVPRLPSSLTSYFPCLPPTRRGPSSCGQFPTSTPRCFPRVCVGSGLSLLAVSVCPAADRLLPTCRPGLCLRLCHVVYSLSTAACRFHSTVPPRCSLCSTLGFPFFFPSFLGSFSLYFLLSFSEMLFVCSPLFLRTFVFPLSFYLALHKAPRAASHTFSIFCLPGLIPFYKALSFFFYATSL